ncbi:hydrogen gas-evolving membrane-bound hydrogenase subunit E [Saccharopolyspora sp. CA-218241]|uniref:hydrogen gas-evolving membrane-bound hydrogenase subunit E n=1 Tax=Saccharopolyspora sp. CA-218241 TaxID=3240027 RepID=UPI003D9565D8
MLAFVIAHLLVALALPIIARRSTRAAFLIAAVPPAAALAWVLSKAGPVLDGQPVTQVVEWAPLLGLGFAFRLDALALLITILVSGIGVVVLLYSDYYFSRGSGDARRSAPLLLAFAGAMLGLVLADDLITVYIFWELTTVCSFLLVGQAGISRESRRSALQALMITILGGLVMLLGFVVLGETAGTYRISELLADPPGGAAVGVAAVLVLIGAFTKSAQIPFHNWLPAAMVAPTPISAYLHAASMVKAGVFLIARLGPVFVGLQQWWITAVVVGLVTMVVGGWRALHEHDLKKLLAYGTISQLGFLTVLFGAGTHTAAMAGATMLLAHGFFKATLFLVVGIVDHETGTRDIRELSGLGRRLPVLAVIAGLAAASMAGIPPLLGFIGKEAAFEAFLHGGTGDLLVDLFLVVGSVFTMAYSVRFLWGAFAAKKDRPDTEAEPPGPLGLLPAALPSLAGLVFGLAYPLVDELAAAYADGAFPPGPHPYHLALWHGLSPPLLLSAIAVAGGVALAYGSARVTEFRQRLPRPLDAQRGYERIMALLERVAVGVTGRTQVGSLPTYIGIILITVLVVPGSALLLGTAMPGDLRAYDNLLQVPLAVVVIVAAIAAVMSRRRLTAVLMVGVVGYGIGGLFIVDGGPDLALAQFLVETLTVVAFVFVLRRLPVRFNQHDTRAFRIPKMILAGAAGVFISVAGLVFSGARHAPPTASQEYIANAEYGAGATNVVNAIIVDFRAFDTVGEISVLAVTATGVASLILASRHERRRRSTRTAKPPEPAQQQEPAEQQEPSEQQEPGEQQEEVRE